MVVRKIIHIDEEKCDGCGLCIPNCAEGALQIIDGKARLVADKYCDGLGDCLGHCPRGAISIIEREAEAFDEEAVAERLANIDEVKNKLGGCPGACQLNLAAEKEAPAAAEAEPEETSPSQLGNWPVQLRLVHPEASFFEGAHLLVAADCTAFAHPDFHRDLLKGRTVVIGCPKLDNVEEYLVKLAAIIKANNLQDITVAYMEVPCCTGLVRLVQEAIRRSGKEVPLHTVEVKIRG
ncbi:MAG: 4Fe-4S binding protein [bacterium]|jgi:NAD-dependent dihydropyrimidine dehydrogenase PreA subunit|nr:4Fe-4S binding protein [Bacillota bacterium]